jgi:diguanylate cyclase (GGDEF)-like protein
VIIAVGRAIQQSIRQYDSVSRWGGDEFIVLLPECTDETLARSGERIRTVILEAKIPANGNELRVTVSVGGYLAGSGEDMELILNKADKALYQAKANGRNGLKIYQETGP